MSETSEPVVQAIKYRAEGACGVGEESYRPQISYSTIAAEEVKRLAARYYDFPISLNCVFYHRGTNDVYKLSGPERQFALRISRVNWRTRSELMAELAVINHIHAKGIQVALPIPRADGGWITEIMAPEGLRRAIVSSWAKGAPPNHNSERQVRQFGRQLAIVHSALDDLSPQPALPIMDVNYLLRASLNTIFPLMAAHRDLCGELTELGRRLESRFSFAHKSLSDWGLCHGDVASYNAHIDEDHCVLFDFDFCGWGWRLFDLASYRFHARSEGFESQAWQPFIEEYLSLRGSAEGSLRHIGVFMCLRHIWLAAKRIEHLVEMGSGSLPDTYFETLVRLCKEMESEFS